LRSWVFRRRAATALPESITPQGISRI